METKSIFDLFLDIKKEKWKFEWVPSEPAYLKKINVLHKGYMNELNLATGSIDQGLYILTKQFIIKLKNEGDLLSSAKLLPLYFPRFVLIKEGPKVYSSH